MTPTRANGGLREHPIVVRDGGPHRAGAVELGTRLAGVVGEPLVVAGSRGTHAVDGLIELARELDASMIVLGHATEEHVIRSLVPRAPCPVVVSRGDAAVQQAAAIARI